MRKHVSCETCDLFHEKLTEYYTQSASNVELVLCPLVSLLRTDAETTFNTLFFFILFSCVLIVNSAKQHLSGTEKTVV